MNRRFNNKSIFNTERNNKDDLFNCNIEKNKSRAGFEKSTNISDNDDVYNYNKSNQGIQSIFNKISVKSKEILLL